MKRQWWEEKPEPFMAELFAEGWKGDVIAVLCLCTALIGLAVML